MKLFVHIGVFDSRLFLLSTVFDCLVGSLERIYVVLFGDLGIDSTEDNPSCTKSSRLSMEHFLPLKPFQVGCDGLSNFCQKIGAACRYLGAITSDK